MISKLQNKELQWTILAQFILLLSKFLLIKLLAVNFSQIEYAYYALILSITSFVLTVPFTAFQQGFVRYASIYKLKKNYKIFYNSMFIFITILSFLYILISWIFIKILNLESFWINHYFYIVLFIITEIYKIYTRSIQNANRERKEYSFSIFLEYGIKFFIILIAILSSFLNVKIVLLAFVIGNLASINISTKNYFHYFGFIKFKSFIVLVQRIWIFSAPLALWAIFGWLRDMSGIWYLNFFQGKEEIAGFSVIISLSMMIPLALQSILGAYVVPILYEKENKEKGYTRAYLKKMIPYLLMICMLGFILVFEFQEWIVYVFSDQKYIMYAWMLPWMFLAFFLFVIAMMSTYEILAYKQTKLMLIPNFLSGIFALIAGAYLIMKFGVMGAMISFIGSYLVYSILTFYIAIKFKYE